MNASDVCVRVISPDAAGVLPLVTALSVLFRDVAVVPAVMNATMRQASLLNRLLHDSETFFDGKQVHREQVVGAFLAHAGVWEAVASRPGPCLVLEDDAVATRETLGLLSALLASGVVSNYHYVNLRKTFPSAGAVVTEDGLLEECPPGAPQCSSLGAVAYLVTPEGAAMLLRNTGSTVDVPVDWFVTALRDYLEPGFRMASSTSAYFGVSGRPSRIGHDMCVLCGLPRGLFSFWAVVTLLLLQWLLVCATCCLAVRRQAAGSSSPRRPP